ncbi:MAG TPA: ABC transporter ATP-binding protein [Candidatus Limnocylindria bacterium]|nr:ABC transporter ATP-binding protein [Candidatus Limnocylindria bacterium]
MQSIAIRTDELAKRYGKITALAGLTMSIPAGDVYGFLGPNGAGKTTAVKLLLGLARPTSGEAWVLGAPLSDRAAHRRARRSVGYLPELFRYQQWLSAREVLRVHCALIGLDRATWDAEIRDALGIVGLAERADDRVGGYSKGMQQRLGLGVALLGRPALVLLDEPTSALDPVGRHDVREVIRALKERGTTVFLNSHLLTEVEQVCDRVAIVDQGRVLVAGTFDELLVTDSVRVRATGLSNGARNSITTFGELQPDGEWIVVRGIAADRVPDLVRAIVEQGGRVYAVEPRHESLEDRFLSLLEPRK